MLNNVFGFTFYALDLKQVSDLLLKSFGKAEAILFSEQDLQDSSWEKVWTNISKIVDILGGDNVSFHFPMDNCDYINSDFIKNRLIDAIDRANNLGIKKIVIHPNLRYKISEWQYIDRLKMQKTLYNFINSVDSNQVTLCLENMPPIGNKFDDADSCILFASDISSSINYTWDICHYFNVVKTMEIAKNNNNWNNILADIQICDYLDFTNYLKNIAHYHFSAFEKIADPFKNEICQEGVLPFESCVSEQLYIDALKIIYADALKNNKSIIFEISEKDYYHRDNIIKMLDWTKKVIKDEI